MSSMQSTQQVESPKLSYAAQKVHDAMMSLPQLSEEQVQANREYNRSLSRVTPEGTAVLAQELLNNLRRNSLAE